MKLKELFEAASEKTAFPTITLQQAHDKKFFGPVYHGTSDTSRENINQNGFTLDDDMRANGYPTSDYHAGIPAPIHHLGYGIYFTTVKAIAKKFNQNSARGLKEFFLNVPRLETINFAAPGTMMKWWQTQGYNFSWDNVQGEKNFSNPHIMTERIRATKNLTHELASKYDAVWFKGKTLYRALDGDQICVFDPPNKIFRIDNDSVTEIGIGAKVRCKPVETIRDLIQKRTDELVAQRVRNERIEIQIEDRGDHYMVANYQYVPKDPRMTGVITSQHEQYYTVKWKKGGTRHNYTTAMLELVT